MTVQLHIPKQQEIRCWLGKHNKLVKREFAFSSLRDFLCFLSSGWIMLWRVLNSDYVNLNFGCLSHIKRPWSWSVPCVMINYFLQSVVLTGFALAIFFLSVKVFILAKWLNINQISSFSRFFFRNAFIWINTCSPCGCFVRQLVWWFPAMFCNAGPSHCFLAKKWSTDANSKERIGLNFYINCWELSC